MTSLGCAVVYAWFINRCNVVLTVARHRRQTGLKTAAQFLNAGLCLLSSIGLQPLQQFMNQALALESQKYA